MLLCYCADDKVTVLESEKSAWENSPEAQAIREALDPWRNNDAQAQKKFVAFCCCSILSSGLFL